jgi:hypothetical protein
MPSMLQMQRDAEDLIRSWGDNQQGQIIRGGVVRATAYMALNDYSPRERGLFRDDSVRIAVSAVGLPEIDHEQDQIKFLGSMYVLPVPTTGGRPDGTIVFHDCNAVKLKG